MSYSITVIGRDKAKLKAAIREQQVKDPINAPHSGVPAWVVDHLCSEVDRAKMYDYSGRTYGLWIKANGSFHEQGGNDHFEVQSVQMVD
jgi:hypothetical protein